jgi:hypothetical protein
LLGSAGYWVLLFAWLFARGLVISFLEQATPSASLGPALLLEIPGVVTAYFIVMAGFCCWCGVALLKLHRWAWFATCAFAILSFVLDVTLFAHMFRHLHAPLVIAGILRFAFLIWIVAYLSRTRVRAAFGLARARMAA